MKQVTFPLPLTYKKYDQVRQITPTIITDQTTSVLVDCGFPHSLEKIAQAMAELGLSLSSLTAVIITHHDYDHMGSLCALQQALPTIKIYSSAEQIPYIEGDERSIRLLMLEQNKQVISSEHQKNLEVLKKSIEAIQPAHNVIPVKAGDVLPYCGGIEIVDTKGHMPGHISVYIHQDKTLVAGDALTVECEKLCLPNPQYTLDMKVAIDSIRNLARYAIDKIICYHGGVFQGNVHQRLLELSLNTIKSC